MANTIMYFVRYRRDANSQPEQAEFNTAGPAYGFAYNIELNGGVALVTSAKKDDPFNSNEPETLHTFD